MATTTEGIWANVLSWILRTRTVLSSGWRAEVVVGIREAEKLKGAGIVLPRGDVLTDEVVGETDETVALQIDFRQVGHRLLDLVDKLGRQVQEAAVPARGVGRRFGAAHGEHRARVRAEAAPACIPVHSEQIGCARGDFGVGDACGKLTRGRACRSSWPARASGTGFQPNFRSEP